MTYTVRDSDGDEDSTTFVFTIASRSDADTSLHIGVHRQGGLAVQPGAASGSRWRLAAELYRYDLRRPSFITSTTYDSGHAPDWHANRDLYGSRRAMGIGQHDI